MPKKNLPHPQCNYPHCDCASMGGGPGEWCLQVWLDNEPKSRLGPEGVPFLAERREQIARMVTREMRAGDEPWPDK